ncbi:MAG: heavy metal-associated domain-containing protein, partial [Bacteroidota bacterium]
VGGAIAVKATRKVTIQTNAICEMCQHTIEKALFALDGVKRAELDLITKKVKVKYDEKVTDIATIRQAIAAVGYDADDVPARPKARAALDDCCKGDGKVCKKPE